jgi:hypothetical protein
VLKVHLVLLLTFLISQPLQAQSIETSLLSGSWGNEKAPIGWGGLASWNDFDAFALGAWVPSGESLVSWDSFVWQAYGLGWDLSGPDGTLKFFLGLSGSTDISMQWSGNIFSLQMSPAPGVFILNRAENYTWGAGDIELEGRIALADILPIGSFRADGRLLFGGLPWIGGFLAEADLTFQSNVSILDFTPFKADGSLQAWSSGIWTHQQWTWYSFSFDLFGAGGLFWFPKGSWQMTSLESKITIWPPAITVFSSTTQYRFSADPGWLVLLKPTLGWRFDRVWSLELSRWLPLAGGWTLTSGASTQSTITTSGGQSVPTRSLDTIANWFLAGANLDLKATW